MSPNVCLHKHPTKIGSVLLFRDNMPGSYRDAIDHGLCHAAISEPRVSFRQCSRKPMLHEILCAQHAKESI